MKEAYLYKSLKNSKVRCDLCNHRCVIESDSLGKCCVRKNVDGILYSLVYRKLISENVDPIEKKPLFHFLPGTTSLSVATVGCNFKCFFCQNYEISQMPFDYGRIEGRDVSPETLVADAINYNCKSISYTYTEPTVYFEYAYDTAKLAHEENIKNVFVTNGFMTKEALEMIEPYLDAVNVDLKSYSDKTYREKIDGRLKPVLDNIKLMKEMGIWVEVTTLIIPGLNDSDEELENIAMFLVGVGRDIPWHISAYFPRYKSNIPPTDIASVHRAIEIGKSMGLRYVYGGNISGNKSENTYCYNCGEMLIRRFGFSVLGSKIKDSKCYNCEAEVDGVFSS